MAEITVKSKMAFPQQFTMPQRRPASFGPMTKTKLADPAGEERRLKTMKIFEENEKKRMEAFEKMAEKVPSVSPLGLKITDDEFKVVSKKVSRKTRSPSPEYGEGKPYTGESDEEEEQES